MERKGERGEGGRERERGREKESESTYSSVDKQYFVSPGLPPSMLSINCNRKGTCNLPFQTS